MHDHLVRALGAEDYVVDWNHAGGGGVPAPVRDAEGRMIVAARPIKGHWLREGYQAAAASVCRWFKERFGAQETRNAEAGGRNYCDAVNDRVSAVPAVSRGLLVLPYFAAAGTPRYCPPARGTIVGLTFSRPRFDIDRAFMEGITLDMKDMLSSMARSGLRVTETRLPGAAILGGVGAEVFSSIEEGADATLRLDERFEPIAENVEPTRGPMTRSDGAARASTEAACSPRRPICRSNIRPIRTERENEQEQRDGEEKPHGGAGSQRPPHPPARRWAFLKHNRTVCDD
jgi:sugar (pentulose or hexulose) kinase